MAATSVIERELRSTARQGATYHLRIFAVLAATAMLVLVGFGGGIPVNQGSALFALLHRTLFFSIWALVPLLSADCLSRERREGTLPLLFLTPLTAGAIVYAKGFAHLLRALTLWVAVLPVLTICFLVGGIGWVDVAFSVLINFGSICMATSAGLLASSLSRTWTRAAVGAMSITFGLLLLFATGVHLGFQLVAGSFSSGIAGLMLPPPEVGLIASPGEGLELLLNAGDRWSDPVNPRLRAMGYSLIGRPFSRPGSAPSTSATAVMSITFGVAALTSVLWLLLNVRFSAWRVKRTWQIKPPSARMTRVEQMLFRPMFFRPALRRWLGWQLQRNPIGWLEQRSWNGRLVIWSWFAVMACVYSSLLANISLYNHSFFFWQARLGILLIGSMALTAAGSFRRERETGVLELLLVAPLSESQIVLGRLRGIWMQFLPAVLLMGVIWGYTATLLPGTSQVRPLCSFMVGCATVPVVGLYFSLAKSNTVAAFIWTVGFELVAPAAMGRLIPSWSYGFINPVAGERLQFLAPIALQVSLALLFGWRLHTDLRKRSFVVV